MKSGLVFRDEVGVKATSCSIQLSVLTLVLVLATAAAAAVNRTWDGSASGNWSNGANWVGGVAPAPGDSLTFPVTATRYVTTNNLAAGTAFGGIAVLGSNYVVRGNALVLQDDLRALAQGGSVTFDLAITIDSPLTRTQIESRYGSVLRFNNTLHIADPGHPVQFIDGVIRVAGAITGPGRIEAIGGDLYLDGSAANTFGGTLELSIGNLYLNKTVANAAIPPGCIVERGGSAGWVRWLRDEQVPLGAQFKSLFLDLNNQSETITDFHTSCLLSNGTLSIAYNIIGAGAYLSGDGNGRLHLNPGNHQLISTNGISTVRYELTGPGSLFKTGDGTMWLERSNSFTGPIFIEDGLVAVRDSHGLGTTNAGTFVHSGATLMLRNSAQVVGEPLTLAGSGHFDPDLIEWLPDGYGALHTISPSNAWTGPITLDGLTTISVRGEGDGSFQTNSALALGGPISGDGSLVKEGLGTLVLSGPAANTYAGATAVREGTLRLDKIGAVAIPALHLSIGEPGTSNFARVELTRGAQIADTVSVVAYPGGVLDMNNQSDIIQHLTLKDGAVDTGSGALIVSGNIQADDHPLLPIASRIGGNGRLLFSPSQHGIHLTGSPENEFALEIACEVGGSGALEIDGAGSLHLSHSNSFSGPLTMSATALGISNPSALGGAANGTILNSNSTLALYAVRVPGEPLTLRGGSRLASAVEFAAEWAGPVTLPDAGTIASAQGASLLLPNTELNLSGVISGPGHLRIGGGQVLFSGDQDNTQTGDVRVEAGTLILSKTNANAIASRLMAGTFQNITPETETVRHLRGNQVADTASVYLGKTTVWELNGFSETVASLGGATNSEVRLGAATLTVDKNDGGALSAFFGVISGSGRFTKIGSGYALLGGDNTYAGPTRVESGWLDVQGIQAQSHVTLLNGATLSGSGTVGHVNAAAGATVAPGHLFWEPAMTTSNLTLQAGSSFRPKLYGHGSNQLVRVRGSVALNSPTLELDWEYIPKPGDTFRIIDNDGNDPVSGTFAGLPGGVFTAPNGMLMEISYGNDVTLRALSPGHSVSPTGIGINVTGGNGNGAIDPNECNQLRVTIHNTGPDDLPPFKTMLVSDSPEAIILQPASDYPGIPVNGDAVNVTPFQISTTGKLECGANIPTRLLILTTNGSAFALDLPLPTGLPSAPVRYDTAPNAPVLDGIVTESVIAVPPIGNFLASVEVGVFIEHPLSSDLRITLVAPDGTEVLLAEDLGYGANYGSACADVARTHFADAAADPVTGATAPFVGTFRPAASLSTLRGMPGAAVAGNWTLRVNDHVHFNTGVLRCWSLALAPAVCTDGGGACEPCPGPIVGAVEPDAPLASGRLNVFSEASNCFSNKACPSVTAEPTPFRSHAFTNLSGQPSCVSVIFTPQCDVDPQYNFNVAAYLGGFNPANPCENFLAGGGTPVYPHVPRKFAFQVPAASSFEIVVTAANNPACAKYQLEVLSPDLCPVSLNVVALSAAAMRLDWPSHAGGYELQRTTSLSPASWGTVTNAPVIANGRFMVTNEVADPNGAYRLRKP